MALTPLDTVSASLAWRLTRCAHEVGLSREGGRAGGGVRLNNTAAVLGTAAHEVLEAALSEEPFSEVLPAEWFEARWHSAIETARLTCIDQTSPERWKRYSIIKRGVRAAAKQLRAEMAESGARPIVETDMWSTSKDLWGRPDVVVVLPDGSAEIIDFKTGAHEGAAPSEKELHQLDFYTVLVEESEPVEVASVRIVRCDGPSWRGPARPTEAAAAAMQARRAMEAYNMHLLDTAPLAFPGEPCTYCRQALGCAVVWARRPPELSGVQGSVESATAEVGAVTLEVDDHGARVVVTGCPPDGPAVGQTVMVAHLRSIGDSSYRWQPDRSMIRWL